MNKNNFKRQRLEGQEEEKDDNRSIINSSMNNTIGNEKDAKIAALESENALLKENYKILECKLSNQQVLCDKNDTLTEEFDKVKKKNQALDKKLKDTERKLEMAKNELEESIQTSRQKLEALKNEIAKFKEQQQQQKETISMDQNMLEITTMNSPSLLRLFPLETWVDLFSFLPRCQLAKLVPQIGDWHFAEKAQFYLHECGQITIGGLTIEKSKSDCLCRATGKEDQAIVKVYGRQPIRELPMANVTIPKNIIDFEAIRLCYFDDDVIRFLHEFGRNSLLTNVNFTLWDFFPEIMYPMLPLFTSINSLYIICDYTLDLFQNEHSELVMPMLTSARVLRADYNSREEWFCNWLYSQREDGKPRMLVLDNPISALGLFERLKKDFVNSNQAVTFFIHLLWPSGDNSHAQVQAYAQDNSKTNERLVITGANDSRKSTISRFPIGSTEEWIEEMGEYEEDYKFRNIVIDYTDFA